ncbi:metallophosphoesterase family protein [Sediminimonas qiaohouensis]|uniref:metallophosphoesterase family protein n=1 Tax=Sediminimonas qiaohouensis TaxID=552061 RepID=UPI0003F6D265|nr:metallophosphoesterase family protein [Sediminimonas qiaohouensis]
MRIDNTGVLDGAVLLFGGVHSNLHALHALMQKAHDLGIPPGRMVCTGDVVAYCAQPAECVDLIRHSGIHVVAGNCERQLASGAMTCGCGFEEGSTCDRLSAGWFAHADAHIGASDRQWMAELPDMIRFHHAGRDYAVIHGGATDISRFVWPISADAVFTEESHEIERHCGFVDVVIAGHCGLAFIRPGSPDWINAGAIGLPPNDGAPQTRFAVLTGQGPRIERLSYDAQGAARQMQKAGLVQGYDRALLTGRWPSEDVLPPQLRGGALASG